MRSRERWRRHCHEHAKLARCHHDGRAWTGRPYWPSRGPGRRHLIWIYEAVVWVGVQHLMPMAGIPRNATGLVFGKGVQESLGALAYVVGTGIHFFFCFAWGVLFAFAWPYFRRRGYEATIVALFYAVIIWIMMHVAIALASTNHPNYLDPNVIIGGFMSHFFYTVPLA